MLKKNIVLALSGYRQFMCWMHGANLCSSCFTFLLENDIPLISIQKIFSFYASFFHTLHMLYCFENVNEFKSPNENLK